MTPVPAEQGLVLVHIENMNAGSPLAHGRRQGKTEGRLARAAFRRREGDDDGTAGRRWRTHVRSVGASPVYVNAEPSFARLRKYKSAQVLSRGVAEIQL